MPSNGKRKHRPIDGTPRQSIPSLQDMALFAEAAAAVTLASLAIKLPFSWVAKLMSINRSASGSDNGIATQIVKAVDRASRRLPWRTVCFQQGLAVHWLLRRRGIPTALHYGIRTGDNELAAHVWVSLNGQIIIGESEASRHALVATFPEEIS